MSATEKDDKSASTPLDAERVKLREAGYTDAEVSQILIARAVGGQQQAAGQGVLSNVVSSIVAMGAHARALVPSFRSDFSTVFGGGASLGSRIGSLFSLLAKMAVIAILAYAAWQEWQQHIISATAIADAEVRKRHAEECSARIKAIIDTVPANQAAEASEVVKRDCDPTYAARAKECDAKFQAMMGGFAEINGPNSEAIKAKIESHKKECVITEAQMKAALGKAAEPLTDRTPQSAAEAAKKKEGADAVLKMIGNDAKFDDLRKRLRDAVERGDNGTAYDIARVVGAYYSTMNAMIEADKQGDYASALQSAELFKKVIEAPYVITKEAKSEQMEGALVSIAWFSLMTRDYKKALDASQQAVSLRPADLVPLTNLAHALLLLGRFDEARAIYVARRGETIGGKKWEVVIREDFAKLRKAGIDSARMAEIESTLSSR